MIYFKVYCVILVMVLMVNIASGASKSFFPCQTDKDCNFLESAKCEKFACVCNGTEICKEKKSNIVETTLGDTCSKTEDCKIKHSECSSDRKCICKSGYLPTNDEDKCVSGVIPCINDTDCEYGNCENFLCSPNGSQFNKEKGVIGSRCSSKTDCKVKYSECSADSKCICTTGYIPANNGTQCVVVPSHIGGSCEDDVQCHTKTNGSICKNNKCVCQHGMHNYKGSCYRSLDLGQRCNYDGQCSNILFARCSNSRCTCTNSFIISKNFSHCLPIATSKGSQCEEDAQCTTSLGTGAACIRGSCDCKELHKFKETPNRCVKDMSIIPCDNDTNCDHLDSAKCQAFACVCNGTLFCKEKTTVVTALGFNCSRSKDCNIENSECGTDNKCTCKNGYAPASSGKKCLVVSGGLGDSCEESVQCYTKTPNTGCQNNKCICLQDMHDYNGTCYRSVDLGQQCKYDGECSKTHFARCEKSRCTCSSSFIASRKLSLCLAIATSKGSQCVEDIQCTTTLGGGAACIDGFCNCKELYQLKEATNRCTRDMLLGDTCGNHSDCHQPFSGPSRLECIGGNCQCRSGYTEIEGYCITDSASLVKGYTSTLLILLLCLYLLS